MASSRFDVNKNLKMKLPNKQLIKPNQVIPLSNWMVWEVNGKNHHIVGYNKDLKEERVTSRVVIWDPKYKSAYTSSGKIYKLVGLPEENTESNHVWARWQIEQRISTALNVSAEYFISMYRAKINKI